MRVLSVYRQAILTVTVLAACMMAAPISAAPPREAQPVPPQPANRPAPIDRNGILVLVRSTLLAVDQANKTGNYTVLRELGSPGFQGSNTPARLGEVFAGLRNQNYDLSGVAVLEPQLTLLPTIEANRMMRMAGYFPSSPLQINFDLLYEPVGGRWRLFGVAINVSPTGAVMPAQAQSR